MRYTLMNQEHEVLEFEMDSDSESPKSIRMLEDAAWAPMEIVADGRDPSSTLEHFLWRRAISTSREDYPSVLQACGARNAIDLALLSGGFSLSDQYWYRSEGDSQTWAEQNFFDNEWDPSFGEAVLRQDYDALAKASVHTPDVTLGGFCRKAWIPTEHGPRLYKAACTSDATSIYCEALVSRVLDRLVGQNGHVPYEPAMLGDEVFSTCPVMVSRDEELVRGMQLLTKEDVDTGALDAQSGMRDYDKLMSHYLHALEESRIPQYSQAVAKPFVLATLALDFDVHPSNFGIIRNVKTLELRQAPLHDHGRGFTYLLNFYDSIKREPRMAGIILGLYFSRLDPMWDYSWYDPHSLDGFEREVETSLLAIESLPEGYAELMANLFVTQRNYVNRTAANL